MVQFLMMSSCHTYKITTLFSLFLPTADTYSGGLECCTIQWHGKDKSLGLPLFCGSHDLWKLCAIQLAGGHPCGGLLCRGKQAWCSCFSYTFWRGTVLGFYFISYCKYFLFWIFGYSNFTVCIFIIKSGRAWDTFRIKGFFILSINSLLPLYA